MLFTSSPIMHPKLIAIDNGKQKEKPSNGSFKITAWNRTVNKIGKNPCAPRS